MSKVYYITEGYFTEEEIRNEKSSLKAIKNYCRYNCCVNDFENWRNCPNEDCFLWKFRMGKSGRKIEMNDEQRDSMKKRMSEMRIMRKRTQ